MDASVTVTWADLYFDADGTPLVTTCQRVVSPATAALAQLADIGDGQGVFVSDQWRGFSAAADRAKAKMIARVWGA